MEWTRWVTEMRAAQPQNTLEEQHEVRVKYISVVCCLLDFVADLFTRHMIGTLALDWLQDLDTDISFANQAQQMNITRYPMSTYVKAYPGVYVIIVEKLNC